MILFLLVCFISSNAVACSVYAGILYSRSFLISCVSSMYFILITIEYFFYENTVSLFNGLIYSSLTTTSFIFFLELLSFFIVFLTSSYPYESISLETRDKSKADVYKTLDEKLDNIKVSDFYGNLKIKVKDLLQSERDHYFILEYPLILQFILIGSITLLSSSDLITMFLAIELQSYGLYLLSTLYRNSESSTSAGLTYFLLGGLSSCIILLGQSFIYINTGTTNLDGIYLIHNIITCDENLLTYFNVPSVYNEITNINNLSSCGGYIPIFTLNFYQSTLQFSFIILSVGFLFKISAAPFHSWSPGVYDAIPTVTTTFIAIIPKISILILLFDLVYYTWWTTLEYTWSNVFLFSSFLSLIIGSVLGLTQFRIKRLYAYSTISHVGFLLLGLSIHSVESIQAFFFYIIQYSLSNLNAFLLLVVIGYTYVNLEKKTIYIKTKNLFNADYSKEYKQKIKDLSPIVMIDQLKGYFYINPLLAISLAITLFSFIGVPPLVGFFAKQMILSSALDNGDIFMCLIAILTSVVSAVYYLYIVKHMFFEKSKYMWNSSIINGLPHAKTITTLSSLLSCIISILSLIMLLFIFLYYEIYSLVNILSIQIVY